jgi:hypothetical protein
MSTMLSFTRAPLGSVRVQVVAGNVLGKDCWAEGDYAASVEEVAERLDAAHRPNVSLVKGWFNRGVRA